MNKLILILPCLLFLIQCAGTGVQATPEEKIIQKVYDVSLVKDVIFSRSMEFVAKKFKSAKDIIQLSDKENGNIICKGTVDIDKGMGLICPYEFTMSIEVKDNRYRLTFDNYIFYFQGQANEVNNKELVEAIKTKLYGIADELNKFVQTDNSNW
jgi:hypothetical protein